MFSLVQKVFICKKIQRQINLYTLEKIYSDVNKEYFDSKLDLQITWSRKTKLPKTRIVLEVIIQKALVNQELLKIKDRLEKAYKAYLSDPNAANGQKVEKDLQSLRETSK